MGDSFFVCHHLAALYAYGYVLVSPNFLLNKKNESRESSVELLEQTVVFREGKPGPGSQDWPLVGLLQIFLTTFFLIGNKCIVL